MEADQDYFKHLEELEHDELFPEDVLYHFHIALESEKGSAVDYTDVEAIYERYKRRKAQKNQVQFLQAIKQPAQRSPEWYKMREGMLTASNIAPILGECPYGSARKVLMQKAGITPDTFVGNFSTQWGVKYEPIACKIYELRTGAHINAFGLVPHYSNFQPQDDFTQPLTFLGASPDGITDDGIMLEIKCPTSREITGVPPRTYWVQMQIQMECCNLDMCHFLECKFSEYALEQDFLDNLHTNSHEKGVIAFDDARDGEAKYEYLFPLPKKVSDIKKWCDDHRSSALLTYFELDKYSCVEVPRDFEWFCASLPKLHTFWREVLNARKHPEKYIKVKKERAATATTATVGKKAASAASTAASASATTAMTIVIDEHDRATIRHLYEATSHLTNAQLDSLHYLAATATAATADDFEAVDDEQQQQQQQNTTTTTAAPMCLITDD